MPYLNGLEAPRRIKRAFPDLAVLVLTMHASEPYLFQMIQAEGAGYVLKQNAGEHLLDAIRAAHAGKQFLYPAMESRLWPTSCTARRAGQRAHSAFLALTEREREVLDPLAGATPTRRAPTCWSSRSRRWRPTARLMAEV